MSEIRLQLEHARLIRRVLLPVSAKRLASARFGTVEAIEALTTAIVEKDKAILAEAVVDPLEELRVELRQCQAIIRQISADTYGREMTPKEYASQMGYDS